MMKVTCLDYYHNWDYTGKFRKATCPSCKKRVDIVDNPSLI